MRNIRMIKIFTVLLAVIILMSAFSACSAGTSSNSSGDSTSRQTETEADGSTAPANGSSMTPDDLSFIIRDVKLVGNGDVEQYISKLGEDYEYNESTSCYFEGNDKMYSYPDFDIAAYPYNGTYLVAEISITKDTLSTIRGAKVGMTLDELTALYGGNYTKAGALIKYIVDGDPEDINNAFLSFAMDLDTDKVKSITISAKINE